MNENVATPYPTPDALWFYADASNEPVGPVPFVELQRLAAAGVIHAATHVIESGGSKWKKFASVVLPPPPTRAEPNPVPARTSNPSTAAPPVNSVADTSQQRRKGKALTRAEIIFYLAVGLGVVGFMIYKSGAEKSGGSISEVRKEAVAEKRAEPAAPESTGSGLVSSIRRPAGKTYGITPETFRVSFNSRASTKNLPERWQIKNIVVEPGEVKNAATFYFTDTLAATVTVGKVSGEIESIVVYGKSETFKQATDFLLFYIMAAATVDSSISDKRVYAIAPKLIDAAMKNVGKMFSEIEGDSKLGAIASEANGFLLLSVEPREK